MTQAEFECDQNETSCCFSWHHSTSFLAELSDLVKCCLSCSALIVHVPVAAISCACGCANYDALSPSPGQRHCTLFQFTCGFGFTDFGQWQIDMFFGAQLVVALCCQKSSNRCRMTCTASRLLLPDQDKSSVSQNRGQQKQLAQHTETMNGLKVPAPTPELVPDCLKSNTEVENAQAIQRKPASDGKCIETVLSRIKMWNYVKFVPKRNVLMDCCCRLLGAGYLLHWWPLWQPQTPPAK